MAWVKNISGASETFHGQIIADGAYHNVPKGRRASWQADATFFNQIANGTGLIAQNPSGNADFTIALEGWAYFIDFKIKKNDTPCDYSESFWNVVAPSTTTKSPGIVIPNTMIVAIRIFKGKGESPDAYTKLVFDDGGANEKIFHAFEEPPDQYEPNQNEDYCRVTGDGVAKIQIITVNGNVAATGAIGAYWEADEVET